MLVGMGQEGLKFKANLSYTDRPSLEEKEYFLKEQALCVFVSMVSDIPNKMCFSIL